MSDEEQDFHIESADAGASAVIPCDAGAIKKGGYVVIRGFVGWYLVITGIDLEWMLFRQELPLDDRFVGVFVFCVSRLSSFSYQFVCCCG
jgi:hypothetical protein